MAVRITHIHLEGFPEDHQHITSYKWVNETDGGTGTSTKPAMVQFIEEKKGQAHVGTGSSRVSVGVVHPAHGAPYLRTYADQKWNNNLLSLPRF